MSDETSTTILLPCDGCGAPPGDAHKHGCREAPEFKRRTFCSVVVVVNGEACTLVARLNGPGWQGEWTAFGMSSGDGPVGSFNEDRFKSCDAALGAAFSDVLAVFRARGALRVS